MKMNRRAFLALSSATMTGACLGLSPTAQAAQAKGGELKTRFGYLQGSGRKEDLETLFYSDLSEVRVIQPTDGDGELVGSAQVALQARVLDGHASSRLGLEVGYAPYHQHRFRAAEMRANESTVATQFTAPFTWTHGLQLHFDAEWESHRDEVTVELGAHARAAAPLKRGIYVMRLEARGQVLANVLLSVEPISEGAV